MALKEIKFRAMIMLVVAVVTFLAGCGLMGSKQPDLENTKWKIKLLDGQAPAVDLVITAEFYDGRISGSSGCNSYGSAYEVNDGKISIDAIAVTEMACLDENVMQTEQRFLELLSQVKGYQRLESRLELLDEDGVVLMSFTQNE
jgi:heat shock protein HslJ